MKWREGGSFENAPAGSHIARCTALIDLGTQAHSWNDKTWTARDVKIVWELPNERMTGIYHPESKGKPFLVSVTTKGSMHPKAKLRIMMESWRGRKFTKEELEGFSPKSILGKACRLTLIESDNGEYTNVQSVSPLGKGEVCPKQINPSLYFSLEEEEFDNKIFQTLPKNTREKIEKSPEFRAIMGVGEEQGEMPDVPSDDDSNEPF